MKILRATLVIPIALAFAFSAQAKNIVKNPGYESGTFDLDSFDFGAGGIAPTADFADPGHLSDGSVFLEAEGFDYSRVFNGVQHKEFQKVNAVSFWYKQVGDADHNDHSPYVVLVVKIKQGVHKDGTLIAVGFGNTTPGQETDWTKHDVTLWHYQVYNKKGNPAGAAGTPVFLTDLQAAFKGEVRDAGIAVGLQGTHPGLSQVSAAWVDDLVVNVP